MIATVYNDGFGNVRHQWSEAPGLHMYRPDGLDCYTFLHFHNPVKILIEDDFIITEPHACITIPPHIPHNFLVIEPLVHDWVHFDKKSAASWSECGLEFNKLYYPQTYDFITDIMRKVEVESVKKDLAHELMIESELARIFIQIARSLNSPMPNIAKPGLLSIQQARQIMQNQLNENWTIKRLSELLGISENYTLLTYKQVFGISPISDLIHMRISKAQLQLAQSNTPIKDIAASLGYTNPYHFYRQFKNITGMSPSEYRESKKSPDSIEKRTRFSRL